MPRLRLRILDVRRPAPFCFVRSLRAAIRQRTALSESRRNLERGDRRLAGEHNRHAAKRPRDGDELMGFGRRLLLAEWRTPKLRCWGESGSANHNQNGWYNAAAFSNAVAGTWGNCARNNLRGPKQVNFDFSALKDFRITERRALQFRVEMFNAPNHVELGVPSSS